jgi:uncharacterized membrane protein
MDNLFRNFDRLSFAVGFILATLFWFLATRLYPHLKRLSAGLQT